MRDYSKESGPTPDEEYAAHKRWHLQLRRTTVVVALTFSNGMHHGSPKDVKHKGHMVSGVRIK